MIGGNMNCKEICKMESWFGEIDNKGFVKLLSKPENKVEQGYKNN